MDQSLLRGDDVVDSNLEVIGRIDARWRLQHRLLIDQRDKIAGASFGKRVVNSTEGAHVELARPRSSEARAAVATQPD